MSSKKMALKTKQFFLFKMFSYSKHIKMDLKCKLSGSLLYLKCLLWKKNIKNDYYPSQLFGKRLLCVETRLLLGQFGSLNDNFFFVFLQQKLNYNFGYLLIYFRLLCNSVKLHFGYFVVLVNLFLIIMFRLICTSINSLSVIWRHSESSCHMNPYIKQQG